MSKNLILIVGVLCLWFMVIRPLTAKKDTEETEQTTEKPKEKQDTPTVIPEVVMNRSYTN